MADDTCNAILLYGAVELPADEAESFFNAMEELPNLLLRPPLEVAISIKRITDALLADVLRVLGSAGGDIALGNNYLLGFLYERWRPWPDIILACADDHAFALAALRKDPSAKWGGYFGPLALTYRPRNRYAIWHEALHSLRAEDCYAVPSEGPTCERSNCIMQYVPEEATVGSWPFLCRANSQRVRERVAAFAAAGSLRA